MLCGSTEDSMRRGEVMGDSLEEVFLIFDDLDRWGLDEVESVLYPFCDAPNDVEVIRGATRGILRALWSDIRD
ncbi:hypothetical protein N9D38_08210 [Rubripirellula sp.]|nr:hypothetical protein [Rubripirellula sp.]